MLWRSVKLLKKNFPAEFFRQLSEMRILKKAINEFNPLVMVDFHEYKPYRVDFVKFGEYGTTSMFDCMFLYTGNLNVCPSIKETIENVFLPRAKQQLDTYGLKYHNYLSSKHIDRYREIISKLNIRK